MQRLLVVAEKFLTGIVRWLDEAGGDSTKSTRREEYSSQTVLKGGSRSIPTGEIPQVVDRMIDRRTTKL